MRHKRYHNWMMLCALMLGPAAASAQAELTPDGGPVTVAEAAGDESVLFANNSAAAIDQDGNVGVAYTVRDDGDLQRLDVIAPGGESAARFEAPDIPFEAFSTPTLSATAGNFFVLGRYAGTSEESKEFAVIGLHVTGVASGKRKNIVFEGEVNPTFEEIVSGIVEEQGIECSTLKINAGPVNDKVPVVSEDDVPESVLSIFPVPDVVNKQDYTITCDDSKKLYVTFTFFGAGASEEAIQEIDVEVIAPPHTHTTKSHGVPPARAPISATGRNQDTSIMAYLAQPLSGSAYGKVTVVELDDQSEIIDLQQIDNPLPKRFPGTSLATCGYADFAHYWVALPTDEGRAVAARFEGDSMEVFDLGASNGAVDLACDGWGNAAVSWAAPDEGDGPVIHTAALGPEGSTLSEHEQTLAPDAFPDPDSAKVSNGINEAGEVVAAWSDGGETVAFQRLKLSGHFRIDGTLSGSHFAPAFNGEGFIFDIVELEGTPTLVVYYFTYQPDGSGEQAWMVGSGPIEDNRAVAEVVAGSGATFGDAFDPADVTRTPAGTVTATFLSCGLVQIETASELFGNLAYIAQPLTGRPLAVDGQCGQGPAGTAQVDASRGGSQFNAGRNGEGFIFDIVNVGGEPTLVIYYFTYTDDGSGDPAWLVGSGPIQGDSATATMTIAEGATFGPDFDPADVARTEWGEITVTWQTCEDVTIEYDGLWGSGSFNVGPLTPPLIGANGLCAP